MDVPVCVLGEAHRGAAELDAVLGHQQERRHPALAQHRQQLVQLQLAAGTADAEPERISQMGLQQQLDVFKAEFARTAPVGRLNTSC